MRGMIISAMASGQGKTTLTCGLISAFQRRGLAVAGFKCGPDYIDPMFHTQVLGVPSRNLDLFLQGEAGVRRSYAQAAPNVQLALVEGAMGFYDGVGGTDQARLCRGPVSGPARGSGHPPPGVQPHPGRPGKGAVGVSKGEPYCCPDPHLL